MSGSQGNRITYSALFVKVIRSLKRKNPDLVRAFKSHLPKIHDHPELGKPLRYSLRNFRRFHIEGSFVLVYEIRDLEIHIIDLDHHDRIYKKYS